MIAVASCGRGADRRDDGAASTGDATVGPAASLPQRTAPLERTVWVIDGVRQGATVATPEVALAAVWLEGDAVVVVLDCTTIRGRSAVDAEQIRFSGLDVEQHRCVPGPPSAGATVPSTTLGPDATSLVDVLALARSHRFVGAELELADESGESVLRAHPAPWPPSLGGLFHVSGFVTPQGHEVETGDGFTLNLSGPTFADLRGPCGGGSLRLLAAGEGIVFYDGLFEAAGCPDQIAETFARTIVAVRSWRDDGDALTLLDESGAAVITLSR